MSVRAYKILVALVLQQTDDGQVVGEQQTQPIAFYSPEKAADWIEHLDDHVAALNGTPA